MRARDGLHFVAALALWCGCGEVATPVPTGVEDPAPLQGGLPSLEALGQAVVDGLNTREPATLTGLLLSEADFKGRLFMSLANHPSAVQMGPDLLWDMQRRQGADELTRVLERFGGTELRFVALAPEQVEEGPDVRFHRRVAVIVDDPRGKRQHLQILGSIVEHRPSGTFKLITYRYRD